MSIIRAGWILKFVEGVSEDYVYVSSPTKILKDGRIKEGQLYVEDYGCITDNGLVEVLSELIDKRYEEPLKTYLIKQLALKLNVKLRKKFLTDDKSWEQTQKLWKRSSVKKRLRWSEDEM